MVVVCVLFTEAVAIGDVPGIPTFPISPEKLKVRAGTVDNSGRAVVRRLAVGDVSPV